MIDSTNPRILADNIRTLSDKQIAEAAEIVALQGDIEALGSYSTDEVDTGMTLGLDKIYRKVLTGTTGAYTDTFSATTILLGPIKSLVSLRVIVEFGAYLVELPYLNDSGKILKAFYNNVSGYIHLSSNGEAFSDCNFTIIVEYTKSAPAALNSPAPDDSRSIEPEAREEDPEAEPIEEPVVEVKKTTRKKTTTTTE